MINAAELEAEIAALKEENQALKDRIDVLEGKKEGPTVFVPEAFKEIFDLAEENVKAYFSTFEGSAQEGQILINGERYVLIRSASLSLEFLDVLKELYSNREESEAIRIGNNFLFDIAHVLGKEDAKAFHQKMKLTDPVQKLSAGPVHFAYTGWANVEILPESNPSPDENFFLKYYHHNSFEAQSWIKTNRKSDIPVCTMNSGYSSGWCEESFGIPLTAVEIECEAHGAKHCTFIMAPPDRIQEHLSKESLLKDSGAYDVPIFFERKYHEEQLQDSLKQKEMLLKEVHHRVKNNLQVMSSLLSLQRSRIDDPRYKAPFSSSILRIQTMASIHEMIYSGNDITSIDVQNYFTSLLGSISAVYAPDNLHIELKIKINIPNVNLESDKVIPLGIIINEIASNSFKHAFVEDGYIYLNMFVEDEKYKLIIGDSGRGLEENESTEGLGMTLIQVLIEQIEGDLETKSSEEGLEYQITFMP